MAKSLQALRVAVRCRPLLPHDRDQRSTIEVEDGEVRCLDPAQLHAELRAVQGRPDYLKEAQHHCRERRYVFDAAFGPTASNEQLHQALVAPLLPHVFAGRHATVFAYGQTGSGKTHTMLGRHGERGLVERVLCDLVAEASELSLSVTFVELYNERLRDLLVRTPGSLELREDPLRGPCLTGVREVPAQTARQVMDLVVQGNERRTEERTAANPVSSRSHAVLQLLVHRGKSCAKLSLIDLAGSERAGNTNNMGARLREGAMINRSLLALANCITALTRKGAYVNYRDSKLTRLLKDALSGRCHTVMIAHVSPSVSAFEETLNTLKYAHRACEMRGMNGGVLHDPPRHAERLRECLDATVHLQATVARLAPPRVQCNAGPPWPAESDPAALAPSEQAPLAPVPARHRIRALQPIVAPGSPAEGGVAAPGGAPGLAEALEESRRAVVGLIRRRVRLEQSALELEDLNEMNAVELAKLCLEQAPAAQDIRELRAVSRRNARQQRRLSRRAAEAERGVGAQQQELVSLLAEAADDAAFAPVHAETLRQLEQVEREQAGVVLEAQLRRQELSLARQAVLLRVHQRALQAAEQLCLEQGLQDRWLEALGPLAQVLRPRCASPAPSVDELLAELNATGVPEPPADASIEAAFDGLQQALRALPTIAEQTDSDTSEDHTDSERSA